MTKARLLKRRDDLVRLRGYYLKGMRSRTAHSGGPLVDTTAEDFERIEENLRGVERILRNDGPFAVL